MKTAWTFDWTDAAIARLTELWLAGHSSGECAKHFGITRSAAIGKINRLGLMRRDRPRLPIMARAPAQMLLKATEQVSKPPQKPKKRQNTRPLPPPYI